MHPLTFIEILIIALFSQLKLKVAGDGNDLATVKMTSYIIIIIINDIVLKTMSFQM